MTHLAARYGVSVFLVGLALAVGLLMGPNFDVKLGPLLFLAAVVLTAWFAGPGPGLAAIVLATLAVEYFWTEPIYSFIIVRQELPLMISFILCGLLGLGLSLQRRRQVRTSEENRTSLERRVAERTAQLRVSEERWRNLFETSSVGIAITEPDGRILRANGALQAMLGYGESDLRLLTLSDLMAGGGRRRSRAGTAAAPRRRSYSLGQPVGLDDSGQRRVAAPDLGGGGRHLGPPPRHRGLAQGPVGSGTRDAPHHHGRAGRLDRP